MLQEILMVATLAAHTCLWTVLAVITFTAFVFFIHRKARRLDYLILFMVVTPIFLFSSNSLLWEVIEHINYCYPPGEVPLEAGKLLLFADMIMVPILTVLSAVVLKAGRILAIVWAKTADKSKAFHAFANSLSESCGYAQTVLKQEGKKIRSLNFVSVEVKEDEY